MKTEISQRVSSAWRNWKRCSGVLCDRRMPVKLKGKVYKTVVRPALFYGAETCATTRGQEARLEVNEMRMLRWMCGVTRRDKIRNDHIRGTTRVVQASKKITEKRLKWYGHVSRMKEEHIVRRMLDVEIPGKRRRGRPNLRWKDACKRDILRLFRAVPGGGAVWVIFRIWVRVIVTNPPLLCFEAWAFSFSPRCPVHSAV